MTVQIYQAGGGGGGSTGTAASLTYYDITVTGSNVIAAENSVYNMTIADLSGHRDFVLPVASGAGMIIRAFVVDGDDTYSVIYRGYTGVTINYGDPSAEWSREFIEGESVTFESSSTTNWNVIQDGRIPCMGRLELSAAETTNDAATETTPTWDTAVIDIGEMADLVNYRFNIRRAGYYTFSGGARPNSNMADTRYIYATVYQNAVKVHVSLVRQSGSAAGPTATLSPKTVLCAVGDYLLYQWATETANYGLKNDSGTFFEVQET